MLQWGAFSGGRPLQKTCAMTLLGPAHLMPHELRPLKGTVRFSSGGRNHS